MMLQTFQNILLYTKTSSKWYYWAKKDSKSISSGGDRLNWIKNDLVPANTKHFGHPVSSTKQRRHMNTVGSSRLRNCLHSYAIIKSTPGLVSTRHPGKLPKSHTASLSFPNFLFVRYSITHYAINFHHICWQDSYPTNGPWCHPEVVVGLGYVGGQWQGQIHVITGLALLPCGKWSSCKSLDINLNWDMIIIGWFRTKCFSQWMLEDWRTFEMRQVKNQTKTAPLTQWKCLE